MVCVRGGRYVLFLTPYSLSFYLALLKHFTFLCFAPSDPARALRAIFWANPWIPELTAKTPTQVSKNWWTYISRMRPFLGSRFPSACFIKRLVLGDLRRWAKGDPGYSLYLDTPTCVGGGCPLEFDVNAEVIATSPQPRFAKVIGGVLKGAEAVAFRLGGYRSALNALKVTRLVKRRRPAPLMLYELEERTRVGWGDLTNHFKSFCEWLGVKQRLQGRTQHWSEFTWPRCAGRWSVAKRIDWLLEAQTITRSDSLTSARSQDHWALANGESSWVARVWNSFVFPSRKAALSFSLGLDVLAKRASTIFFTM